MRTIAGDILSTRLILKKQDPKSKRYFQGEKRYLLGKLDNSLIDRICHFGSTAIPGIAGKGFIDIYLILKSKRHLPKVLGQLASKTDYEWRKHAGSKERVFLRRTRKIGRKKITFHLHVSWKSANEWKRDLLFTEYCIKHPEAAKRYEELKYEWAEQTGWIREEYKNKKTDFVNDIIRKARNEMKRGCQ